VDATYRKCREASFERSGRGSCFKLPLILPNGFDNRWLETTTPPAVKRNGANFLMRSHPSFAKAELSKFFTQALEA